MQPLATHRLAVPLLAVLVLLACALGFSRAHAAPADAQPARDAILVLDASGSMWARMDGKPQITVAKTVIRDLLTDLPPSYELGLMAYGHRRKGDCSDIQMLVDVGEGRDAIRAALADISPKGKTPMTAAVTQAAEALKYTENKATVILVSDGKETCGLDPCTVASKLEKLGVNLTVHAIGFGMQDGAKGLAQVRCLAENTGGRFFAANNAEQLASALEQVTVAAPPPPDPEVMPAVEVHLEATALKGGPVIEKGLIWLVRHGATDETLYQSDQPEGAISIELPKGVHDVAVVRVSDQAGAKGEIVTGTNGTSLTLPIVVKLNATVKAPEKAQAGETIRVVWTGPNHEDDYVGVFAPDAGVHDDIHYTRTRNGNPVQLKLPEKPGSYEIRYVLHDPRKTLATRTIEVGTVAATLQAPATAMAGETINVAWTGPEYEADYIGVFAPDGSNHDDIHYRYVREGNPVRLKLPEKAGSYEIRYVLHESRRDLARQSITVTPITATLEAPATAAAGETIEVAWSGPDYDADYIGVFAPDGSNHDDIHYRYVREGNPVKLKLPEKAGSYEIRYVLHESRRDLAHQTITVTPITATLQAPATAAAGETIEVAWSGPDYDADYIGVFAPDGSNHDDIHYRYVREGNPVKLQLPEKPGTYEIRYVLHESRRDLARRTITVTPKPGN